MSTTGHTSLSGLVRQAVEHRDLTSFAQAFAEHVRAVTGSCMVAVAVDGAGSDVFAVSTDGRWSPAVAAAVRERLDADFADDAVRRFDAGVACGRVLVDGTGSPADDPAVDDAVVVLRLAVELAVARNEAAHDPLTGLANRRSLAERLGAAIEEGNRYSTTFAFALIDMNNFKWFNDTYGHAEGDRLLRAMAKVLGSRIRKADVAARYGGDEFVLLLPHTTADDAATMLERIAAELHDFLRGYEAGSVRLGFSFGLAHYPADGRDWETLVRRADERLYQAKQHAGLDRR